MGIVVSLIFLAFFLYFFFAKHYNFFAPECFFCFLWFLISFGACFCNLWGIPDISFKTWLIILVGVFGFVVGCGLVRAFSTKPNIYNITRTNGMADDSLNVKLILIVFILSSPFIFYMLYESILMLKAGWSLRDIRSSYYGINGYEMYWASSIYMKVGEKFLVSPFKVAIVPITISTCIRKKPNFLMILISLIMIAADILTTGGRFVLLYVAIEVVAALVLLKKRIRIKKRVIVISAIALTASLVAIVLVSNRRGMTSSWLNKIYEYFFCCIPLFDYYVPKMDSFTFGTASFNGFINPFTSVFSKITPITTFFEEAIMNKYNIQAGIQLSPLINTNAFVTSFFYTYLDFGFVGTFILMLIFGLWSKIRHYKFEKVNSISNLAVYLLVIQGLFKTIQHFPFCASDYAIGLILIYFFSKRKSLSLVKTNTFKSRGNRNVVIKKNVV